MLPLTSIIHWKTERESTPKKLVYSTSKSGTTFQVGIQSSNSLIKMTRKLLVLASTSTSKSSTLIRRQIPTFLRPKLTTNQVTTSYDTYMMALATQTTSAIIENQDRQESSISSQLVEHCPSYEHHNVT